MNGRRVMLMLLSSLIACLGCSDKNGVPRGILPRERMEQVMWDMAQADQYAALYLTKDSMQNDRKAETMRLYEEVFRLHQITPGQFRKSYHYYLDHPELNQLLFDSVITRGVRARSEMYDRPSSQYRPPVGPVRPGVGVREVPFKPGVVRPGAIMPGEPSGAKVPNKGGRGTMPGRSSLNGGETDIARRFREAASRRQDSIMRAMHVKRDTTRRRP